MRKVSADAFADQFAVDGAAAALLFPPTRVQPSTRAPLLKSTMSLSSLDSARSFLFVPANRPERFAKAIDSGADAVILDLEDSVPMQDKDLARALVQQTLAATESAVPCVVRINSPQTPIGQSDVQALANWPGVSALMVPKCESSADLDAVITSSPGMPVLPIIESAEGYLNLRAIAHTPQVRRLVLGHVDFLADTGITLSSDQRELDSLRFEIAMCTRSGRLAPAIDGVTVAVDDVAAIHADTERAIRFGMGGKLCIHPRQVSVVHAAFQPSAEALDWARRVVDAMQASSGAAVQLDGKMIDLPVLLQAQRLLSRAQ